MITTKTISVMTFAAALCWASSVFAGSHVGATGITAGTAGVRSDNTMTPSDQRERERSRTNGNMSERERERERELPNGVIEEKRQEQRTNAAGQTQTRSQKRAIQPNP